MDKPIQMGTTQSSTNRMIPHNRAVKEVKKKKKADLCELMSTSRHVINGRK